VTLTGHGCPVKDLGTTLWTRMGVIHSTRGSVQCPHCGRWINGCLATHRDRCGITREQALQHRASLDGWPGEEDICPIAELLAGPYPHAS
jgi:hypothetical protein